MLTLIYTYTHEYKYTYIFPGKPSLRIVKNKA